MWGCWQPVMLWPSPATAGVLINTSRMRGVRVDPEAQTARVEAGALWADVTAETQLFGLAGLRGSASGVGVVGYTMGGGFAWLGRKYGFNADTLKEADVVTADGELLRVSAYEHPDLFWGLKGGGGNFGIVTSMEFALYPLTTVYGGNLFYPLERASRGARALQRVGRYAPRRDDHGCRVHELPALSGDPRATARRGRSYRCGVATVGTRLEAGEELLRPWREFGEPEIDMFGVMPFQQMDMISMDPPDPLGVYTHVELLGDLTPEAIEALVNMAGAGSNSPLIMLELRHLGGALARPPADLSPMGRRDSKFLMFGGGPPRPLRWPRRSRRTSSAWRRRCARTRLAPPT